MEMKNENYEFKHIMEVEEEIFKSNMGLKGIHLSSKKTTHNML